VLLKVKRGSNKALFMAARKTINEQRKQSNCNGSGTQHLLQRYMLHISVKQQVEQLNRKEVCTVVGAWMMVEYIYVICICRVSVWAPPVQLESCKILHHNEHTQP
jgi:hypothetical protein